jgi:hypothetical protein
MSRNIKGISSNGLEELLHYEQDVTKRSAIRVELKRRSEEEEEQASDDPGIEVNESDSLRVLAIIRVCIALRGVAPSLSDIGRGT